MESVDSEEKKEKDTEMAVDLVGNIFTDEPDADELECLLNSNYKHVKSVLKRKDDPDRLKKFLSRLLGRVEAVDTTTKKNPQLDISGETVTAASTSLTLLVTKEPLYTGFLESGLVVKKSFRMDDKGGIFEISASTSDVSGEKSGAIPCGAQHESILVQKPSAEEEVFGIEGTVKESTFVEYNDEIIVNAYCAPLPTERMLVRDSVVEMCAEFISMMEAEANGSHHRVHVVMEGTPHIGKSVSMLYFLLQVSKRASLNVHFMVVDTRDGVVLLERTRENRWLEAPVALHEMHIINRLSTKMQRTVYFFDATAGRTCPSKHGFDTIAFSSPTTSNCETFKLQGYAESWFQPTWSLFEAMVCRHFCYPHITVQEVEDVYDVWGGLPLFLFQVRNISNPTVRVRDAKEAVLSSIRSCTKDMVTNLLRTVVGNQTLEMTTTRHKLVHRRVYTGDAVDPDTLLPRKYRSYSLVFGSKYIMDELISWAYSTALNMYTDLMNSHSLEAYNASMMGQVYERVLIEQFAEGVGSVQRRVLGKWKQPDQKTFVTTEFAPIESNKQTVLICESYKSKLEEFRPISARAIKQCCSSKKMLLVKVLFADLSQYVAHIQQLVSIGTAALPTGFRVVGIPRSRKFESFDLLDVSCAWPRHAPPAPADLYSSNSNSRRRRMPSLASKMQGLTVVPPVTEPQQIINAIQITVGDAHPVRLKGATNVFSLIYQVMRSAGPVVSEITFIRPSKDNIFSLQPYCNVDDSVTAKPPMWLRDVVQYDLQIDIHEAATLQRKAATTKNESGSPGSLSQYKG